MCLTLVFIVNCYIRFDLETNDDESIIYSDDVLILDSVDYEVRYSASYLLSNVHDIVFDDDDNDSDGSTVFSLKKLFY